MIPAHRIDMALKEVMHLPATAATVILATCNRCEIYAAVQTKKGIKALQEWFVDFTQVPAAIAHKYMLTLSGQDSVRHLMRVTASMESMLLGEAQILGQVKSAYRTAQAANTLNKHLAHLFEDALAAAKEVRDTTEIARHAISFPSVAVKISQKIFRNLEKKHALLIGSGEMLQLAAKHFRNSGVRHATISSRSPERMRKLAAWFENETLPLEQVNAHLGRFDIIISATASKAPIINKTAVVAALEKRKHKPMYLVDFALPQDVESSVGDLENVHLYTLEKLAAVVQQNRHRRTNAVVQAEAIIRSRSSKYFKWLHANRATGIINRLRNEAHQVKKDSLEKALGQLRSGKDAEEVLTLFATTLTNRLIHRPTQLFKDVAAEEEHATLQVIERLSQK